MGASSGTGADMGRKPTTLANYRTILGVRLLPRFGEMPVDRVRPAQVEAPAAPMIREGISGHTRANTLKLLSQTFNSRCVGAGAERTLPRSEAPADSPQLRHSLPRQGRTRGAGQSDRRRGTAVRRRRRLFSQASASPTSSSARPLAPTPSPPRIRAWPRAFRGHGHRPELEFAGAQIFVMPGPYERADRVAAALEQLPSLLAE